MNTFKQQIVLLCAQLIPTDHYSQQTGTLRKQLYSHPHTTAQGHINTAICGSLAATKGI